MEHICTICNKNYKTYKSLWNHKKKFHINPKPKIPQNNSLLKCKNCDKVLSRKDNLLRHEKKCYKIKIDNENLEIKKENIEIRKEMEKLKGLIQKSLIIHPNKIIEKELETIKNDSKKMNNQLINIIIDKNKTIEELKENNIEIENQNNENTNIEITQTTLTIDNIIIFSRNEDKYINATQLCNAGNKNFNDWFSLDSTKQIINELEYDEEIPVLQLIDTNKNNTCNLENDYWIHPDLAIQLAQWISPKFGLNISRWVRMLFNKNKFEINIKMMKDKDQKIKLLENICIKKQRRINYAEGNVIYLLTTEDNKKKRIYIIGKAKNLKDRLSTYNKTSEHEVIYYKGCKNEEQMGIIETIVLNKLDMYREKANRDRFVLPIEKNISLFIKVINESIEFFNLEKSNKKEIEI
jgi:hypothetical protein